MVKEGFTIREPEWNDAITKWNKLVDSWPTEELQRHNKHIFRIIIDQANKREQRGHFGKVTGPDMTLYFAPNQKVDIGSGQDKGPSGVSVYEVHVAADYEKGYLVPDADIDTIEDFWQQQVSTLDLGHEGYHVIQKDEDVASGMNGQLPALEGDSLEDKAYHELMNSLGQRVKAIDNEAHELTIVTGGASAIKVKVVGYEHPDLVNAAKAQEDAVSAGLPPTDKITDQVEDVRKYNTDQYMKYSTLNPKKFG